MSKRTLLLADDSVTIQKVVNLTFADEGIEVVTVGDGDTAMEKISEIKPDVVLADVHMPGLSGYQICEIVRENPVTKDMPVVLLVGSFEPFDESEAARVGANAYLTKPFQSIRQLVSQVTDLMDASAPAKDPVIPQATPEAVTDDAQQDYSPAEVAAQAEPQSTDRAPDTTDIDSLYHQSFSDMPTEDPEAPSTSPTYVDAGMDDEMIDTNVVASPAEVEEEFDESQFDTEETYEVEQPPPASSEYIEPQPEYYPADDAGTAAGAFDTLAEEQAQPAASEPAHQPQAFDEFSRTEQIPEFERPRSGAYAASDDMELLELPPIENGKTLEFTTTQRAMAEAGGRELVSISPELMDIIVQKVVEKLSEKF